MESFLTTYLPLISTVVVAVATVVLVFLTGRYVCLTKAMVDGMKQAREPCVSVDFELPDGMLRFVVSNSGLSPARDIRFSVLRDVGWIRGARSDTGLRGLPIINRGISYLVPGRKLKYELGYPEWRDVPERDLAVSIGVTHRDQAGEKFSQVIDVDMSHLRDVLFESFKDPGLAVAEAVRDVEHDRQTHAYLSSLVGSQLAEKHCPVCGEEISRNARKCPHCREWLSDERKAPAVQGGDSHSQLPPTPQTPAQVERAPGASV